LIQKDAQHSLADFSLMGDDESSLFAFEGQDFSNKKSSGGLFLNLPQRERKKNYDVNEYYRAMGGDGVMKEKATRVRKGPIMHDFQFYQKVNL
jgi:SWI/SNF-related matrix-associated actin-dependent regulator of chromatin subfamily A member 5